MTKRNQDVEFTSGDHHDVNVTILDAAGEPQDITSWTFEFRVAREKGDTPVLTKVTPTEIEITSAADGELTIHFVATDTKPTDGDQIAGIFVGELSSVDDGGTKTTELDGRVTINQDA